VVVHDFTLVERRGDELDVHVVCSSGTYVRALARDLGAALGVGAHLTALRRTRVGPYDVGSARTLDELATRLDVLELADAVAAAFPRVDVDADTARRIAYGQRPVLDGVSGSGPTAVFDPHGGVVALVEPRGDGTVRSLAVFVGT
jgi:tRNA pseudouridine55 synthase